MTRFSGYAALWDRADRAGDVFRRGAFGPPATVPLLREHRGAPAGLARVAEDARGLWLEGEADAAVPVAPGCGLSVGYRPVRVRTGIRRELLAVALAEVSLVARPTQPLARVAHVDGQGPTD